MFGMGTGVAPPVRPPGIGKPHMRSSRAVTSKRSLNKEAIRGQAARPISTGKLNPLRGLHLRPINLVIFQGPSEAFAWEVSS